MLTPLFILPLLIALLCLALDRRVPTRRLGITAAAALLVCSAGLLVARMQGQLPLVLINRTWMELDDRTIPILLVLDLANWLFVLLALAGGGLSLLALALAIQPTVRGFGGLFAAALLALSAVAAGLANQNAILLPFMWALVALLGFLTLRASGTFSGSDAPLLVLLGGLAGALITLGAALVMPGRLSDTVPMHVIVGCWILVGLLAQGAPPFHSPTQAIANAPAALASALLACGLPLLGGYMLLRFVASQDAALPAGWRLMLTLLGLLALLACAAGALGTTRLRALVAWQYSAQAGLLLVALGQRGAAVTVAAPALLANGTLATLACYLAVAALERRAGTDDMAELRSREPLVLPGLLFLIGAASATGLPGTWGWWARRWLFDELLYTRPWILPILLAGSALLALAFVAPLALFWRGTTRDADRPLERGQPALWLTLAVAGAPLLILGVQPRLAWSGWLADLALAPATPAVAVSLPGVPGQVICGLAALLLVALPLVARSRRCVHTPDVQPEQASVFVPSALGESLRGLAWVATPIEVFGGAWMALLRLSRGLRRGLALFEQRYYLAGLLIAVILVIMLFIQ
jgi:formate hydrogenlyase subunit 3/multisubunit Na+/H+ antiporter MnhD subunit